MDSERKYESSDIESFQVWGFISCFGTFLPVRDALPSEVIIPTPHHENYLLY